MRCACRKYRERPALGAPYSVAWLCDVWGVLHDGIQAFEPAVQACLTFRKKGGAVVLISNSPRPSPGVRGHLRALGVPDDCFDALVTSGDVTRDLMEGYRGKPIFHLGPPQDKAFFEGLAVQFSSPPEAAVIVCTGLFDDERESPEDYRPMLAKFAARRIPMICANPDLVVERGRKLLPCAGALAALYEGMGQTVIQAGKPFRPIYELALGRLTTPVRPAELLAIGDGVDTDIKGAFALGIDAIYVASRVHIHDRERDSVLDSAAVDRIFAERPRPLAAMLQLKW